jgi:hypothetical protein
VHSILALAAADDKICARSTGIKPIDNVSHLAVISRTMYSWASHLFKPPRSNLVDSGSGEPSLERQELLKEAGLLLNRDVDGAVLGV